MKIEFTKMQGLGNDFILINTISQTFLNNKDDEVLSNLSRQFCNRRFGIGADQVLLLAPSQVADSRMRIFNADGSEVEMCGNGIRCLAHYIWDRGLCNKDILNIETLAGIIRPAQRDGMVRVDMGKPEFQLEKIPMAPDSIKAKNGKAFDIPFTIDDKSFLINCLSMGNPHCVIILDDASSFLISRYGSIIEKHPLFPNRTNVEFIQIMNNREIRMRVWERGVGETLACGTGAAAAVVVTAVKGLTDRWVTVHLTGGDLFIEWEEDGHVYMTGPAVTVFDGLINIKE